MSIEFHTKTLDKNQLKNELEFIAKYLLNSGISECKILFGFGWGINYYPTNQWLPETILIGELISKIHDVETQNLGQLGKDDLFISLPSFEIKFCNDGDLHLSYSASSKQSSEILNRWQALGFEPRESKPNKQLMRDC
ncbi:hypothetical protein H3302_19490 [Pseudoalteromonas sp. MT33b]|jgi:hypothetical protein|uniref:hypothetical protein n=1 Tax=Pseudoalteromonas sp. MT33b TaxID=2759705 RepID=UPI0015FE706B|nr:hypothetical protein [Pseudoalteromonas sp. MT33b]QMW16458.1 hypothetical protein H3302_19490 [Pseudoalteromonas sp. MT33b]